MKDNRSLPEIEEQILKSARTRADDAEKKAVETSVIEGSSVKEVDSIDAMDKNDATTTVTKSVSKHQEAATTSFSSRNLKFDDDTGSLTTLERPSTSSSASASEGMVLEGWMASFRSTLRFDDMNDSERIRCSVEPLPSTTGIEVGSAAAAAASATGRHDQFSSTPGAHSVSSPGAVGSTTSCTASIVTDQRQRLTEEPHGSSSRTIGTDDVSSIVDLETGSHHLVEAHLVNDDDDVEQGPSAAEEEKDDGGGEGEEVVHAEKLVVDTPQQQRLQGALAFAALAIVVLVVTVIALLVRGGRDTDRSNKPDADPIDPAIPPSMPLEEENDQSFVLPNATNSEEGEEVKCLDSSEELYNAITAYFHGPSPNSTTALQYGYPIGSWCVSKLWNFGFMMKSTTTRNHYVADDGGSNNNSNTQEAQDFATNFSEDIGNWDMSKAQQLEEMFYGNQRISTDLGIDRWDLSSTTSLRGVFMETHWQTSASAGALNLSSWNTSRVKNLAQLFRNSDVEVAGVAKWDTSQVTILWQLANQATSFNDDLSQWNVERVTSITGAFQGTQNFQQNLNKWKTSSLVRMNMAFLNSTFNQPLNGWDVSKLETLRGTFKDSAFNQDINDWDVSNLNVLRQAFASSSFNQDIAQWDVSKVVDARWTFTGATNFSQNLCAWGSKLPPNVLVDGMFKHTACPNTSDPVIPEGPFCFNC